MREAKSKGFRLLPSYYDAIRNLPDELRLEAYDAVWDAGFCNEVGDLSPAVRGIFLLMSPTIERSIKFEAKQSENGSKGGRPKAENREPNRSRIKTQNKPNQNPNETQNKPKDNPTITQQQKTENLAVAVAFDVDSAVVVDNKNAREGAEGQTDFFCAKCGKKLTKGVAEYSLDRYGSYLCQSCQKKTPKKSSQAWTGDHSHPGPEARKLYERLLKEEEEAGGVDDPEPAEEIYEGVPF